MQQSGADIGANLLDPMFQGQYNGTAYHEPDLDAVLARAWGAGVEKIVITAGTLGESRAALALARTDERLFCTVGVHPTRCAEFEAFPEGPDAYLAALVSVRLPLCLRQHLCLSAPATSSSSFLIAPPNSVQYCSILSMVFSRGGSRAVSLVVCGRQHDRGQQCLRTQNFKIQTQRRR